MLKSINRELMLNKIRNYYNFKNNTEFAKHLGIKPQTLSSWKSRNTFNVELLLQKCGDISQSWLLTGEGEMLKEKERATEKEEESPKKYTSQEESYYVKEPQPIIEGQVTGDQAREIRHNHNLGIEDFAKQIGVSKNTVYNNEKSEYVSEDYGIKLKKLARQEYKIGKTIPLYNIDVAASNVSLYNDEAQHVIGYMSVTGITDSAEKAVTVSGNSMHPIYPAGSIIAIKEIKEFDVMFEPGLAYLVETREQQVLKYLKLDEENPDNFIAVSENKNYQSFPIPKSVIVRLWKVMGRAAKDAMG